MTLRLACPRCDRQIAIRGESPVRHKDDKGLWCSGEPKDIYELVADILDSSADQRRILSSVTDAYISFGEALLAASDAHIEAQTRTNVLVQKATQLLEELVEQKKPKP